MKRLVASGVAASLAVYGMTGCTTPSKDIATTYVSPQQYQSYDCAQLAAEDARIQARVLELRGQLDKAASKDKAAMGVGLILFWPALFALGGTKQQEEEYARLRGERDGIQQASEDKNCPDVNTPSAQQPKPTASAASAAS